MKRSLKIGSVAGIGIYLHWTFTLLLLGVFGFYLWQGAGVAAALVGVGVLLAVFGCVVLHELGHALAARHYDVPTESITIYPIGGIARLERIPEEPMKEFWIALAGPAVNFVIALVLGAWLLAAGGSFMPTALIEPGSGNFVATLLWLNVVLVIFNLLPAFPMDGGRILRALLATRLEYSRASRIAANIGQAMAVLFGIGGLLVFNPFLVVIAAFVFFGARQESQQALTRAITRGVPVRQVMLRRFAKLSHDATLQDALEELLAGSDQDFPVVRGEEVVGVLTRKQLLQALTERGREVRVEEVMEPTPVVEETTLLESAFEVMDDDTRPTVPVLRSGRLVGLLTLENVGELLMISSALRKAGRPSEVRLVLSSYAAAR